MNSSPKIMWMMLLILIVPAFCHASDEMEGNEISEDFNAKEEGRSSTYDTSFLDEILGPDYFEDKPSEKLTQDKDLPVPSKQMTDDKDSIEPIIVAEKAFCTGCTSDVNKDDAKIKEIALYAFKTYVSMGDDSLNDQESRAQSFIRVIKAQTQVVAGYKYILKIEIGYLNCSKSLFAQNPESCQVDSSMDTAHCDFEVVEKAWLGNREVVKSECNNNNQDITNIPTEKNYDEYQSNQEDDQEEYDATTTESPQQSIIAENQRKKRDTLLVETERLRNANESEATIMEMAKFAAQQLDVIDEDDNARMVLEVISVKKQVVAEYWLYHLKMRVAQTSCREDEEITYEKCKGKIQLPFMICNVKVLFQPWQIVQKKVTESQCFPEKMKRSKKLARKFFPDNEHFDSQNVLKKKKKKEKPELIGAPKEIETSSPELQHLLDFVVEHVDQQSNALHAQKLVQVIKAERQVVNGILTKMIIETGYTNCRKSQNLDKSQCEVDENREHQFCKISVWEKPWLREKKVTESKCGNSKNIMKRKKRDVEQNTVAFDQLEEEFGSFVNKYEKKYATPEEYQYRLGVFKENMKKVKFLQDTEQGTGVYGATIFADLTDEEFAQNHLGLRPDLKQKSRVKQAKIPPFPKLPAEFDWRHYNAVTPVKNQGSCGSCWAFSVTGNIEGLYARKHNTLLSFSEQELVDCDTLDSGCGGGLPENAYKALQKIGGLEEESAYPYDGKNEKCHFKSDLATAQVTGYVEVPKNETLMAAWLVKNGPISIGINANAMQFYFGGVSHPWKYLCSPKSLDHGVLIVGYGVYTTAYLHKVMPYWLVKNSWGPHWGESGYYRVFRGDGTCGLNLMATSAVIA